MTVKSLFNRIVIAIQLQQDRSIALRLQRKVKAQCNRSEIAERLLNNRSATPDDYSGIETLSQCNPYANTEHSQRNNGLIAVRSLDNR